MTDRPATLPSESKAYRTSPGERLAPPWTPGPLAHSGLKSLFGAWRSSIATGSPTGPTTSPRQGGLWASPLTGTHQQGLTFPADRSTVRRWTRPGHR
jgi:hypothetical protein